MRPALGRVVRFAFLWAYGADVDMLNLQIEKTDALIIAKVSGELGASESEEFTETLHEHAAGQGARLAIDLSQAQSIDSTGLSALISLVTRARLSQGQVALVAPSPLVAGVLNVTRLDQWFDICDSIEMAAKRLA